MTAAPACGACEYREPEITPDDDAVIALYAMVKRWGFNEAFFRACGLRMERSTIEKLSVIDEEVKAWRKSE